jgi:pimeloyl-ACP methyl ester carboxylesterase
MVDVDGTALSGRRGRRPRADLVPLGVAEQIVDAVPRAELVVVAGTGHFSYLERPEHVLGTIAEFLTPAAP